MITVWWSIEDLRFQLPWILECGVIDTFMIHTYLIKWHPWMQLSLPCNEMTILQPTSLMFPTCTFHTNIWTSMNDSLQGFMMSITKSLPLIHSSPFDKQGRGGRGTTDGTEVSCCCTSWCSICNITAMTPSWWHPQTWHFGRRSDQGADSYHDIRRSWCD